MYSYILCLVSLVSIIAPESQAQQAAMIKSRYDNQMVTSTTLQWRHAGSNGQLNNLWKEGVIAGQDILAPENELSSTANEPHDETRGAQLYVCRARLNGVWVAGGTRNGSASCAVGLHGQVMSMTHYDVLLNTEGGGRLTWRTWNRFTGIPMGAVASEVRGSGGLEMYSFVARRTVSADDNNAQGVSHYLGHIDIESQLDPGKISVIESDLLNEVSSSMETYHTEGEILVETEPIRYELRNVKENRWRSRVTSKQRKMLASVLLKNEEMNGFVDVEAILAYNYTKSQYWGQGHAAITALPLTVYHQNGTLIGNLTWGQRGHQQEQQLRQVRSSLPAGAAQNVSVVGNLTKIERPYSGKLVSIYADGLKIQRDLSTSLEREDMLDVEVIYGEMYFLHNGSAVPTTTTTSTTTTTTTTEKTTTRLSTSTSTSTQEPTPMRSPPEDFLSNGESNDILPDDAALSLQKEPMPKHSAAETIITKNGIILTAIINLIIIRLFM